MNEIFKKKKAPVILTIDQLQAVLELHQFAGDYRVAGAHFVVCGCGKKIEGWSPELRRHTAEEIAKLQV